MKKVTSRLAIALLSCMFVAGSLHAETAAKPDKSPASTRTKVPKLSAEYRAEIFAIGTAMYIAEQCDRIYKLNDQQVESTFKQIEQALRKQGFTTVSDAQMKLAMPDHEVRSKIDTYARQRNLRNDNASTWCPAGQAEIAQKTKIGKYLLKK
jgi:hypothetical protein